MDPFDLENALLTEDPTTGEQVVGIPENKEDKKKAKEIARQFKSEKIGDANAMVDKADIARLLNQQESGIENLQQALIDAKSAPKSVDWKPFAAWLDAGVKGQHLAEAMPAHETPQARAEKIARIENLIQEARKDTTKNAIDAVKTQLVRQQLADVRRQNFMEGQALRKEDTIRKDVMTTMSPFHDAVQQFETMDEALDRGDYQSVSIMLSPFARTVGQEKGALSEGDVQRALPGSWQGSLAKTFTWLGSPDAIKFTPNLLKGMRDLVQIAKVNTAKKTQEKLNLRRKTYQNPKSQYFDISAPGSGGPGELLFRDAEESIKSALGQAQPGAPQQPTFTPWETFKEAKKKQRGQ